MKINYDKVTDAVYIQISAGKVAKTVEVNRTTLVDLNSKGNVIGYEMLNYSSRKDTKSIEESVASGVPINIVQATPVTC